MEIKQKIAEMEKEIVKHTERYGCEDNTCNVIQILNEHLQTLKSCSDDETAKVEKLKENSLTKEISFIKGKRYIKISEEEIDKIFGSLAE